jgi:hypothetical protein
VPNFILSYDLNGPHPTHKQMDRHLSLVAPTYGRLLETVWYAAYAGQAADLRLYVQRIFPPYDPPGPRGDRVLVVQVASASWRNLLVRGQSLQAALTANA